MSFRANKSVNFQTIFTNEVSKSKLSYFFASKNIHFVHLLDFRTELFFSKLVLIFETPCSIVKKNLKRFFKKMNKMRSLRILNNRFNDYRFIPY